MRISFLIALAAMLLAAVPVPEASAADIKRYDVPVDGSPSIGPAKADITIIEFIDYQ